jgi:hypothetical protein
MRNRPNPAEALVQLARLEVASARQATWRQAIAALAQSAGNLGPPPLDGLDEQVLERAAQVAMETGLADDLDWIAPGSAAVALYELSSCLPAGQTKRELRRRVFSRLYEGTAAAFVTVASRMALGAASPLESPTMRARVALCLDLPAGTSVNTAPLALALASRPELREQWLTRPSTQALPARRLAAQLLEHAAREAVFRHQLGDTQPLGALTHEELRPTFQRLLLDREPLVWRHAAVARGLLASVHPGSREEVLSALDPSLSATEWRRGVVSLVASLIDNDEETLRSCYAVIEGELAARDPGLIATLLLGLPRVVESEPDRAEALLDRLATTRRADVAEAVARLMTDVQQAGFGVAAAAVLRDALAEEAKRASPLHRALSASALRQLRPRGEDETSVSFQVRAALLAFESEGAKRALELASEALGEAHQVAGFIESHDPRDDASLPQALAALQDVDVAAVERPTLVNLLLLGRRPGEADASVPQMERLYNRLSRWVLAGLEHGSAASPEPTPSTSAGRTSADQRKLRVLLHLADAESAAQESEQKRLVARLRQAVSVLLGRLAAGPDPSLHRVLCAALGRSFDAAVREGAAQASDLVLVLATTVSDPSSVATIAEACTNPAVSGAVHALARFLAPVEAAAAEDTTARRRNPAGDALAEAARVMRLSQGLGSGGYRGEALRRAVFRLARALEGVASARGQTELVESGHAGRTLIDDLEGTIDDVVALTRSARRRVLDVAAELDDIAVVTDAPSVAALIDRAVRVEVPPNGDQWGLAVQALVDPLPEFLAHVVQRVLDGVRELPITAGSDVHAVPLERRKAALPNWLLPRRMIGSYYVVRPLGSGGVSTVFLARRQEERHDAQAESFALKVPEYDPTTARSLSEQEFLQMFRDEAGALLSLPAHENLARFVTFDLAARPKPILVMELIAGASLDRILRSGSLTMERAFLYLDGILAGLEAMHTVGVGHLDVKPSNVILRDGITPVLVDFGLSGRHLRPGCGTLEYTSPEVLGVVSDPARATPPAADVYAFGCLAFELLTGNPLFEADDELAVVSSHLAHDGWPEKLAALSTHPSAARVAPMLGACLRRDPALRPSAKDLRVFFQNEMPHVAHAAWPLRAVPRAAAG